MSWRASETYFELLQKLCIDDRLLPSTTDYVFKYVAAAVHCSFKIQLRKITVQNDKVEKLHVRCNVPVNKESQDVCSDVKSYFGRPI